MNENIKVFRFHQGADVYGWGVSKKLGNREISAIKDPHGEDSSREITSIPSPFARIDLINTAFREVSNRGLEGGTIFHKMVSDALDVGQILFDFDKYKDKIKVVAWDPIRDINALKNSSNEKHQLLGRSLDIDISHNKKWELNNFHRMNKLYLIVYNNNGIETPIGGTSPASLFFTSANSFDFKGEFRSGQDVFFDENYCSLHERDPEYVKYLFGFKKSIGNFSALFPSVYDYLEKVLLELPTDLTREIYETAVSSYNDLPFLNINSGNEMVHILSHPLKRGKGNLELIKKSDFIIASEKPQNKEKPVLALPITFFDHPLTYVSAEWEDSNKAPVYVQEDKLEERVLPFENNKHPWLTISDFLEPVIVRTSLPIDDNYYFTGNYISDTKGYLLPLKPLFFEYFTPQFLTKTINGEKVFTIEDKGEGNALVTLQIPVQKGHSIKYSRMYYDPKGGNKYKHPEPDERENKGAIIENHINLAITPFYKFPDEIKSEYNVAFYDTYKKQNSLKYSFNLSFFNRENDLIDQGKTIKRRNYDETKLTNMTSYMLKSNFSRIVIEHQFGKGVLIPKLKESVGGSDPFTFSIDFGTTNTHIEYKIGEGKNGKIRGFSIDNKIERYHAGKLIKDEGSDERFLKFREEDLFPDKIDSDCEFKFPQRTSLVFRSGTDFMHNLYSLGNINIPFKYEKYSFTKEDKVKTNLKWNTQENSQILTEKFFEQLFKMIRNTTLLNGGNLSSSKIIWTYPASMREGQLQDLEKTITEISKDYLGTGVILKKVCESLTPFYYHTNKGGVNERDVLSIDIGGGTSDVAYYKNGKPVLFSSYRFASDAIFGDNYNRNASGNGFIHKFSPEIRERLEKNGKHLIISVLDEIEKDSDSSNDLINAFFSFENNADLRDQRLNFLTMLQKEIDLKIIFLLFFTGQVYHVAQLLHKKGLEIPGALIFSGTASKLLTVIDVTPDQVNLRKYSQEVFDHVYSNGKEKSSIKVVLPDSPKEYCSKGGILYEEPKENFRPDDIKEILVDGSHLISGSSHGAKASTVKYSDKEKISDSALRNYSEFLQFFFEMHKPTFKSFGISSEVVKYSKEFLNSNKEIALNAGINKRIAEGNDADEEEVSETFFFYPLTGSLGELAYNLVTKSK